MKHSLLRRLGGGIALLAGVLAAPLARAAWPEQPVRVVVAFPPGASTDVLVRALGQALTPALGQPVVVENRPGAGGNIAVQAVMRGPADGYTFLAHSVAYAVNPSLYRNAGYDAARDMEAVALLASTPNIITVNPEKLDVRDLAGLLAAARARPLDYASSGTGTTTHLGMELLFRALARVEVQHVPFGPAQAVTAVAGGQTPMASTGLPPALPLVREGRLRGIAVTSLRRDPALPQVPTVAESGYPGFEALTWFALLAPAGNPAGVNDRLHAEVNRALGSPEVKARLDNMGFAGSTGTRAEAAAYIVAEVAKWAAVVRASGATAD